MGLKRSNSYSAQIKRIKTENLFHKYWVINLYKFVYGELKIFQFQCGLKKKNSHTKANITKYAINMRQNFKL